MKSRTGWIITMLILLVTAGAVDRWWRYRRSNSRPLTAAILGIENFPDRLGPWSGEPVEIDEALLRQSVAHASRVSVFRHDITGQQVYVAVLAGYPGLMTAQLPEESFAAMGMTLEAGTVRSHSLEELPVEGVMGELVSMDFRDPGSNEPIRVWHGWYDHKSWSRPDWARFRLVTRPVLFQLQVWSYLVRDPFSTNSEIHNDPSRQFLIDELAEITARLSDDS